MNQDDERYRLEATDREDLGADLNAPLYDDSGKENWRYTLQEVQVLTEQYRQNYNRIRPHSSLGYRPPAPEAMVVNSQPTNGNTAPMTAVALT